MMTVYPSTLTQHKDVPAHLCLRDITTTFKFTNWCDYCCLVTQMLSSSCYTVKWFITLFHFLFTHLSTLSRTLTWLLSPSLISHNERSRTNNFHLLFTLHSLPSPVYFETDYFAFLSLLLFILSPLLSLYALISSSLWFDSFFTRSLHWHFVLSLCAPPRNRFPSSSLKLCARCSRHLRSIGEVLCC